MFLIGDVHGKYHLYESIIAAAKFDGFWPPPTPFVVGCVICVMVSPEHIDDLHKALSLATVGGVAEGSPMDSPGTSADVDANGMGNFPPMVRLLVRIADRLKVAEDSARASKSASELL